MLLDFRPRFVGGHGVEARYRDVCSIARSLRGLLDVCSIPAEGTRRAPDRPAQPADLVPPVEPPPGGGETARSCGVRGYGVMLHGAPSNRAGAPPAPPVCTAWTIGCAAEWRRGVGRQARQSASQRQIFKHFRIARRCPRHFGVSGKTVRSCSFRPGKLRKPKGLARYFCAGK